MIPTKLEGSAPGLVDVGRVSDHEFLDVDLTVPWQKELYTNENDETEWIELLLYAVITKTFVGVNTAGLFITYEDEISDQDTDVVTFEDIAEAGWVQQCDHPTVLRLKPGATLSIKHVVGEVAVGRFSAFIRVIRR
jgi:hypothetical protein